VSERIDRECEREQVRLQSSLRDTELVERRVHDTIKFTRLLVDYGRDADVMTMTSQLRTNFDKLASLPVKRYV